MSLSLSGLVGSTRVYPHTFLAGQAVFNLGQPSGAVKALLPSGGFEARLGNQDLRVYLPNVNLSATAQVSASSPLNNVGGFNLSNNELATDVYQISLAHDLYPDQIEQAEIMLGMGLQTILQKSAEQAIAREMTNLLLYGNNINLNEGVLNSSNITVLPLPVDPASASGITWSTYTPLSMSQFLIKQIGNVLARSYQAGLQAQARVVLPANYFTYLMNSIIASTSYITNGSATTAGVVTSQVVNILGASVEFAIDDTLIGRSGNASFPDAIIIAVPEAVKPRDLAMSTAATMDLNTPPALKTIRAFSNTGFPQTIVSPLPTLGGMNYYYRIKCTPGWVVRPDFVTVLQVKF